MSRNQEGGDDGLDIANRLLQRGARGTCGGARLDGVSTPSPPARSCTSSTAPPSATARPPAAWPAHRLDPGARRVTDPRHGRHRLPGRHAADNPDAAHADGS